MRKINLPLTVGMGIFCLIFRNPCVLAKPSQLNTVRLTSPPAPLLGEGSNAPPFPGREGGLGGLGLPDPNSIASQPTGLSSKQVMTAETISAANPITPESEIRGIEGVEPALAPSPLLVQKPPEDISQEAIGSMVTLEDQVTSVTQLTDVQPSDWAFEALRSLVERYGAIAGYPDGTFRGNRSMTRYEFAAALNAALDRINELIRAGSEDRVSRDDLTTLQRLQQEFATELATLRGRVDGLEARTAELEATQFSTTTKLTGQVIFAVNGGGFDGDRIISPTGQQIANTDPNVTSLYRAAIDLDTRPVRQK